MLKGIKNRFWEDKLIGQGQKCHQKKNVENKVAFWGEEQMLSTKNKAVENLFNKSRDFIFQSQKSKR